MRPEEQEKMDGSPAHVTGQGIDIKFQLGPVKEVGVNGCQIEDVIEVLIDRLDGFQQGPFPCSENIAAILALKSASAMLDIRTRIRKAQGVEGTNKL